MIRPIKRCERILVTRWICVTLQLYMATNCPLLAQSSKNVNLLSNVPFAYECSDIFGYVDANGREYAIVGYQIGTAFYDISAPRNPVKVGDISGPNSIWRDIRTYQGYAYVVEDQVSSSQALQIIDLSDLPNSVRLAATYNASFSRAHNLEIDVERGLAFAAGGNTPGTGISILSLANPTTPVAIGAYTRNYVHDVHVRNGFAYASAINNGSLQIIDITTPASPRFVNEFFTIPDNFTHNAWTTADGRYIATGDEVSGGKMQVWDISDHQNPLKVSQYTANPSAIIHNVVIKGDSAYIAFYTEGLRVVDLSDPTQLQEVAHYDTWSGASSGFHGAWGVYPFLPSGNIILSDIESGLYVFELIPQIPGAIAFSPNSFAATLTAGASETQALTIGNDGAPGSTLTFNLTVQGAEVNSISRKKSVIDQRSSLLASTARPRKGQLDQRRGLPVMAGRGGPDQFGYSWIDSDESGGPSFNWVDISAVGSPLSLGDDDFRQVTLPFAFPYYGEFKTAINVSSNGYLTFSGDGAKYLNDPIPSISQPNDFIAPFWDDLLPATGAVYHYDDVLNRRFIVQYQNVASFGFGGEYTFQVILHDNGEIVFQYASMNGDLNQATVGTENRSGSDGLQVVFNNSYIHNELAVKIALQPQWLTVSPASGSLAGGASTNIDVTFDASLLSPDTYNADILIDSSDPATPRVTIPVTLIVTDSVPASSCFTFDFPNLGGGWYLISLPITPNNTSLDVLFPGNGGAFAWDFLNAEYTAVTALEPGKAVWLYMPQAAQVEVCGTAFSSYTNNYTQPGWDLLGAVNVPGNLATSPANAVAGLFAWDPADKHYLNVAPMALAPGQGYWALINFTPASVSIGATPPLPANVPVSIIMQTHFSTPPAPPVKKQAAFGETDTPTRFEILHSYPNPLVLGTPHALPSIIEFRVPNTERVVLNVFDILGREVRRLLDHELPAGTHRVIWNGNNDEGGVVKPGVYFYRLSTGSATLTKKLMVMHNRGF